LGDTGLYPVMSIYSQGKPVQIAASKIKAIQETWSRAIYNAKSIAIIGANPHPPDVHIWKPLLETNAKLVYCGDQKAFTDWSSKYRSGKDSLFVGNRFLPSIDALLNAL